MTHVVIIGGGPGGYEAALVAARLGAQVTVVLLEEAGRTAGQDPAAGAAVLRIPSWSSFAAIWDRAMTTSGRRGVVGSRT